VAIRVVLADDHYLTREGVRGLLETDPEIEIVAVCGDLDSLLAAVDDAGPDVVVTDIRMPPLGVDEGIQAAARLRETHPDVGVVVLSQYAEPGYALALLEAGTAGRGRSGSPTWTSSSVRSEQWQTEGRSSTRRSSRASSPRRRASRRRHFTG
jgi:DNA-binding NarL/FixJ family response regulator